MDHDKHPHALPIHHGLLSAPRVADHPAAGADDEAGTCGLCGTLVWMDGRLRRYRAVRPWVPLLCCRCCTFAREVLAKAIPDLEMRRRDVPDLAELFDLN